MKRKFSFDVNKLCLFWFQNCCIQFFLFPFPFNPFSLFHFLFLFFQFFYFSSPPPKGNANCFFGSHRLTEDHRFDGRHVCQVPALRRQPPGGRPRIRSVHCLPATSLEFSSSSHFFCCSISLPHTRAPRRLSLLFRTPGRHSYLNHV